MKRTNHTRDNWRVRTVTPPSNDENLTRAAGACRYVESPYYKIILVSLDPRVVGLVPANAQQISRTSADSWNAGFEMR